MQTEGDEYTLNDPVNPSADIARTQHELPKMRNAALDDGLDEKQENAYEEVDNAADDGDESCAAEKGENLWQLDFVEAIVQRRHAQTNDNTAEPPICKVVIPSVLVVEFSAIASTPPLAVINALIAVFMIR